VIARAKGIGRTILVSDAVALARMPPGVYDGGIGGQVELRADGRLSVLGTPYLAGSASSLKDCFENAVRLAGCGLEDAIRMASANPAALLQASGAARTAGALTVFRWDAQRARAEIAATFVGGRVVFAATTTTTSTST
jgi:N-acetylglucosamine-6-phosphate deacetylase